MKKGLLFLFSLILLLLPGCKAAGGDTMDQALAFRAKLQGAEGCSFRSEITADYRDEVFTFTLSCTADQAGGISFQVEAPESIAGISGRVDGETGKVTFDGTALAFGPLADGQLSPLATPHVLVRSWRTGYITACGLDGEELRMTVDASFEENPITIDTWLDGETKRPVYAEVCYNGLRLLTAVLSDFEYIS